MDFLYPWAFWALLGIPLFFFFSRPRPATTIYVPSLHLWHLIPAGHQIPRRLGIPSFLALSIYLLLTLAMSHPLFSLWQKREVALVLDRSASMQTQIDSRSLFQRARTRCDEMLRALSGNDEVHLFLYPWAPPKNGSPDEIRRHLQEIHACDGSQSASAFWANLAAFSFPKVYFLTDGNESWDVQKFPFVQEILLEPRETNNVGFIAFQIQSSKEEEEIFAILENFSSFPQKRELRLLVDDRKVLEDKILLQPQSIRRWGKRIPAKGVQKIALELGPEDNLDLDNSVFALRKPFLRLWIPSDPSRVWKSLPSFLSGITLVSKREEADCILEEISPHLGAWLFSRPSFPVKLTLASFPIQAPLFLASADPLLDAVYPERMEIPSALPLLAPFPPETKILLDTRDGPILAYGPNWLYMGFAPEKTNWQELPSFPIFWRNAFDFFAPDRGAFAYETTQSCQRRKGIYEEEKGQRAVLFLDREESNNQIRDFAEKEKGRQKEKGRHQPTTGVSLAWPPSPTLSAPTTGKRVLIMSSLLLLGILWYRESPKKKKAFASLCQKTILPFRLG